MERSPYEPPSATLKDQPDIAPPKPAQITLAVRILWAGLFAGLVGLLPWFRGNWWLNSDGTTPAAAGLAVAIVLTVIFVVIFVALLLLIGRRHNWARWVLLAYVLLGWIVQAVDFPKTISETPLAAGIDFLIAISEFWACYLLFLSSGAKWFKRQYAA